MIKFKENTQTDMSGGKDEQTLVGSFQLASGGLASTTAVDWHLKVKNKKCDVGIIKNYCIKVSMQKISSIQKLNQQILGSHEHFDQAHPKIIEITFSVPEFAPACEKSVHSINSFL